jgi:hypothetical protein
MGSDKTMPLSLKAYAKTPLLTSRNRIDLDDTAAVTRIDRMTAANISSRTRRAMPVG